MNWRLFLSKRSVLESLRAAHRIGIVVMLVTGCYAGYSLWQQHSKLEGSKKAVRVTESARLQALEDLRRVSSSAAAVSPEQLQADAPAQFTSMFEQLCREHGVVIDSLEADTTPRAALDQMAGGAGIEGWVVLGHSIQAVGPYSAIRSVLHGMQAFPMPLEFLAIETSRTGSDASGTPLVQLKLTVEVYQPGSPSAEGAAEPT
ncbi:MAG: hypothetical protein AMXMBFR61_11050 [Fimbriimonadales bacterium]